VWIEVVQPSLPHEIFADTKFPVLAIADVKKSVLRCVKRTGDACHDGQPSVSRFSVASLVPPCHRNS